MVHDCRFLNNPYWVPELRRGDGRDPSVAAHVAGDKRYADFADKVRARLTAQQIVSPTLQGAISGSEPAATDTPTTAEPANQG